MTARRATTKIADPVPPGAATPGLAESFSLGVLDQLINFRLRHIRNYLTDCYRKETLALGLKAGAFGVMAVIDANPGISQIDLARFGGYDQTVLVGVLDDIEQRGWATRTRDPSDRRRHRVALTNEGKVALDGLLARALENERPAREALTAAELRDFRAALDKIYHHLL
ncbi:DNA-binding transcriptional regulator, MarR family [Sphingomonas guangdongensis]|uniref:DNA-binding transcriptional regulator, MarR family n=1 Tax=Sphingomonas guangdongensis TaxID=1141890 RepID=A0A285QD88_9SPHN|nr:MarR family transcriptional regulator [Sphingomonas guangdongensis]SOB79498.1 DNA-binding transcriptional regulator, MarR family [Sphingomonas guangdongensis]